MNKGVEEEKRICTPFHIMFCLFTGLRNMHLTIFLYVDDEANRYI